MATYKKRGLKSRRKDAQDTQSATAEVFKTLDTGASRIEKWVLANQRYIFSGIGIIALSVLGYIGYKQFIQEPREKEASGELFYAQRYFDQALNSPQKDSLYTLALKGAEGKYGFLDIIENYKGTKAANLARYSAGIAYLNLNAYREAIAQLEEFSSGDALLAPMAKGAIGDAFMQLNQPQDALSYYEQAFAYNTNEYTTPRFLFKAGLTALSLKQADKALTYFKKIKDEFPQSEEGKTIDAYIGYAENLP